MKNLINLFVIMSLVAVVLSCSKDATSDDNVMLKKAAISYGPSTPVSLCDRT